MSKPRTVRRIVIELDATEYNILRELKGTRTWKEFIFDLIEFRRKILSMSLYDIYKKIIEEDDNVLININSQEDTAQRVSHLMSVLRKSI